MRELDDSSAFVDDTSRLRERIAKDGYVFFRGLLDPAPIRDLAGRLLAALQDVGWLTRGVPPAEAALCGPARDFKNGDFFTGYTRLQKMESFHALPRQPALTAAMRTLVGQDVFCHPRKVGRLVWPSSMGTTPGDYVHQDFVVEGVPDMFTTWIPLVDCGAELGGLAVLTGSQNEGIVPRLHRVDPTDDAWASTDYQVGDVLAFHCLTAHGALPNRSERLRLSADYRWQSASQPIPSDALSPHLLGAVPDWDELTTGWSDPSIVTAPEGITVLSRSGGEACTVPPSPFVDVPRQSPRDGEHAVLAGLFNNLRDSFRPGKAGDRNAVIDYVIDTTGGHHHHWRLVVADGACQVRAGDERPADVTIRSEFRDYLAVMGGKLDPGKALAAGRLRVDGDLAVAAEQLQWFRD